MRKSPLIVRHSAALNFRTRVRRAGSMYQMAAKMKEMMESPATPQTNPISISRSHFPILLINFLIILWQKDPFFSEACFLELEEGIWEICRGSSLIAVEEEEELRTGFVSFEGLQLNLEFIFLFVVALLLW
uniref:Uncharacterized protein n=1 Tax=Lepeophtheirus salmonis TaxID=72036 RepID=A0A0K2T838_LEPSM